jgi:predicted esterase
MILALLLCLQDRMEMKEFDSYCLVHKPRGYADGRSWPVVVDLHSMSPIETDPAKEAIGAWKEAADQRGFFVVAPQSRTPAWNTREKATDGKFVRACLSELKTRYRVDPERVLLAGFSDGADFAAQLAREDAAVFAGVAPFMMTAAPALKEGMPVYLVLGGRDPGLERIVGGLEKAKPLPRGVHVNLVSDAGHERPSSEVHGKALAWFEATVRPRGHLEAVDDFIRQGRYLDASLVAMACMEREADAERAKFYLNSIEATGLTALFKVEVAFTNRKYVDAVLRCREAAVQFAWLPSGEKARARLKALESDPRVRDALKARD